MSTASGRDPLDFSGSLELLFADPRATREPLIFRLQEGNQFYFVLPDGLLPAKPQVEQAVPYLRFTAEGRRDCMLARMSFMRSEEGVSDAAAGLNFQLAFRPCMLVGRTSEGKAYSRRGDPLEGAEVPPPPEATEIPDIGSLLSGLQQTRDSLGTIDTLLETPDALLVEDDGQRHQLQETIAATKDQVLIGLGQVGELLAHRTDRPVAEWRLDLSKAISTTIEAMVAFEDMTPMVREEKRRELEALKQSIHTYFGSLDPDSDFAACQRFSSGINKLLLEDRKQTLQQKQERLTRTVARSYDGIIGTLQQLMPKGVELPVIPFPYLEPAPDCHGRIVFNMIHLVLALRYGGLSIRLETENHPRLASLLLVGDGSRPPRVHIIDRRTFALRGSRRASALEL